MLGWRMQSVERGGLKPNKLTCFRSLQARTLAPTQSRQAKGAGAPRDRLPARADRTFTVARRRSSASEAASLYAIATGPVEFRF